MCCGQTLWQPHQWARIHLFHSFLRFYAILIDVTTHNKFTILRIFLLLKKDKTKGPGDVVAFRYPDPQVHSVPVLLY